MTAGGLTARLTDLYDRSVLAHPVVTLIIVAVAVGGLSWFSPRFRLDASSETLVMENDQALRYYRTARARYGSDDYLIATYTPEDQLFTEQTLGRLQALRDELAAVAQVASVTSLLDVPILQGRDISLTQLADADLSCGAPIRPDACRRILDSPLYRNMLVSPDGGTTALRVVLAGDEDYRSLLTERDRLRVKAAEEELGAKDRARLADVEARIDSRSVDVLEREQAAIERIREVLAGYEDHAQLHLGGVPMIVVDSINFIRHDLIVFGGAVGVFIVVILAVVFRKARWVVLPLMTCLATVLSMIGFLGMVDWRVTVVSSNFVALLLILTLALVLHLIVRYRELQSLEPDADRRRLVRETVHNKFIPCLYTALTTMVAFGSLLVSGIRPVIDFGWMMVIGLAVAFVLSFTLFPAALVLLYPGEPVERRNITGAITAFLARLVTAAPRTVLMVAGLLAAAGIAGAMRLSVENRFIDYYKSSTEIYQGMALIDRELGGTTPLDVILDAPVTATEGGGEDGEATGGQGDVAPGETREDDPFADAALLEDAGTTGGMAARSYWYNTARLPEVFAVHDHLAKMTATGKVTSLAIPMRMFGEIQPALLESNFQLSIFYRKLPDDVRKALFDPYLADDGDQIRFGVRVYESDPGLDRDRLLRKIRRYLTGAMGYAPEQVHLTGMVVLYNNMLQTLFRSQILTLGAVFVAIMVMFLVLFRSLKLALVGIVPNLLSAALVLGVMGWVGIPLDLMTITIAAITIGIGVDDTIHYIHRFGEEFPKDRDYWAAVGRCHGTIGRAMYYTSIIIILGFSVLVLSSFVPTIYFGVLTGTAMSVALLANMTVLPALIVMAKAEGPASPYSSARA